MHDAEKLFVDQSWSIASPATHDDGIFSKVQHDRKPLEILALIHGTSSPGSWSEQVEFYADEKASPVLTRRCAYDDKGIPRILWTPHARREGDDIYQQLCEIAVTYPGCPISIAAHSYGTCVIAECLARHPELRLNKLFLIGSLLPEKQLLAVRSQIKIIIADCTPFDLPALMAHAINRKRFEARGMFGYSYQGLTLLRRFEGGHSTLTSLEHFKEYVFPALEPENTVRRGPPSRGAHFSRAWVPAISIAFYGIAIAILVSLLAIIT